MPKCVAVHSSALVFCLYCGSHNVQVFLYINEDY